MCEGGDDDPVVRHIEPRQVSPAGLMHTLEFGDSRSGEETWSFLCLDLKNCPANLNWRRR
jgi:hypothetical protein